MLCLAPDCSRKAKTRMGYCIMHYKRVMRNGTTETTLRQYKEHKCEFCKTEHGPFRKGLCNACRVRLQRKGYVERDRAVNGTGTTTVDGYALVTENGKRVYLHRLIMEELLGRKLTEHEVVHHIDGDKLNNDPSNLKLFASQAEHAKHHYTLKKED